MSGTPPEASSSGFRGDSTRRACSYFPSLPEFLELASAYSVVPIYRQLLGDTLTPVTAFHKIQEGEWAFLFESVVGGERLGRYSFLGAEPFLVFQAWDRHVRIDDLHSASRKSWSMPIRSGCWKSGSAAITVPTSPACRICGERVDTPASTPSATSSGLPNPPEDDRRLPDLSFAFYDRMVIFDHINKTIVAVGHAHAPRGSEPGTPISREELVKSYEEAAPSIGSWSCPASGTRT